MAVMNTPLVNFICHPDFAKISFLLKIISVHFSKMKAYLWEKSFFKAFYIFTETKTPQA